MGYVEMAVLIPLRTSSITSDGQEWTGWNNSIVLSA